MVQNLEHIINKLQAYNNRTFPIVSVYLEIPQAEFEINRQLRNIFEDLVRKNVNPEEAAQIQPDLNYIQAFLSSYKRKNNNKSMAIFTGGNKLWEVVLLHDHLPNLFTIRHYPYLKPLLKAISKYRRFLIILADRQKARYFTLHMGQLESQGGVDDPGVPQKITGRGAAELTGRIDRHIRKHLQDHFKYIGDQANYFVQGKQLSGVIIGGHKEIMNNLKDSLPKDLQQKIVGEFISELKNNANEVLAECKNMVDKINQKLNRQQIFSLT